MRVGVGAGADGGGKGGDVGYFYVCSRLASLASLPYDGDIISGQERGTPCSASISIFPEFINIQGGS